MLKAEGLGHHVGGRQILAPLDLEFAAGRLHAVLGPNGAGKSTLLKLLSGEWHNRCGRVSLHGKALENWDAAALARVRAVLPQTHALSFPFTAAEVVGLGRLLTQQHRAAREAQIIEAALDACGASHLAARVYPQLSGGERARVQLARALAQIWDEPDGHQRYLLLDEPTAHLDLAYQHACLRLARDWSARGVGIIAVLHDPNLVLAYADSVCVIGNGQLLARGNPAEILMPDLMQRVYQLPMRRLADGKGRPVLVVDT